MNQTTPVALVTGANKGIGFQIARQIGLSGARVLIGARDAERGRAAAAALVDEGLNAQPVRLDVTEPGSIDTVARAIEAEHGHLDILVNNAGIVDAEDGPPGKASVDAVRRIFETNFFGALAVTQAMLPLLRRAEAARIVNLSSSLGSLAVNSDPSSPYYAARLIGYNASKAALNMLTVQLAAELRDTKIAVNSVSPGYVQTDLTGGGGFMTPEQGASLPVEYALLGTDAASGRFVEPDGETAW
jgi:NAD(P)-dependent dehydrogenase (short-subunit alcohol dehydrogenase family)